MDTCEKWLTHLRFGDGFINILGHWNYEELINIITDVYKIDFKGRVPIMEKRRLLYHLNKIKERPSEYFNYSNDMTPETKTVYLIEEDILEKNIIVGNSSNAVEGDGEGEDIDNSDEIILIEDDEEDGVEEDEEEDVEDDEDSENSMKIPIGDQEAFEKVYTFLESYTGDDDYFLKKGKGGECRWYSFYYKTTILCILEGSGPHVYGKGWLTTPSLKKQHDPDRYSSLKSPSWNFEKWPKSHSRYAFNYSGKELDSISTLIDFLTP